MKRIKILFLVIVLSISITNSYAQRYISYVDSSTTETVYPDIFKKSHFKFSPLNLIEIEPSFQLGYEYNASAKLRIQHELGFISYFNPMYMIFNSDWKQGDPSSGFRFRTTFKIPLKNPDHYENGRKDYLGFDVMFKYFKFTTTDVWVSRYDELYNEKMDLTFEKYVYAAHIIYGFENYLNLPNNFINDFYFGLGIRYKSYDDNIPEDSSYFDERSFFDSWKGAMISVMAGYKIGFGL